MMEPIDWIAVLAAALVAAGVLRAFWGAGRIWPYLLQLVPAAMLGHALARIGADRLAARPHLFFMQAGGLALAFVLPALWLTQTRDGVPRARTVRDSLAFVAAYLAMGLVFYLRG